MEKKHNNLNRLLHRAAEELNSAIKVSCNTSITNFAKIVTAKALNYKLNKDGKKESQKDIKCLSCKHDVLMQYLKKDMGLLRKHISLRKIVFQKTRTLKIKYGSVGGKGLNRLPNIVKRCVQINLYKCSTI